MNKNQKLVAAALAGLLSFGIVGCANAEHHETPSSSSAAGEKHSCSGMKASCKGEASGEKASCKGDKTSCKTEAGAEKASCKGEAEKASCAGH